jgi:hypothetical protein
MSDAWIAWAVLAFGACVIGTIIWLAIRGWVKYPEERGRGGFPFNNNVPGVPPQVFDRTQSERLEAPELVIPSEKSPGGEG